MNKWTYLLVVTLILIGAIAWTIYMAVSEQNIVAIVVCAVVITLLLVGFGYGLSQLSTRNTSHVLQRAMLANMLENQSVVNNQIKAINAMNNNALLRASHRMPEITVEPVPEQHPMFLIDDTAFDALENDKT